MPDITTDKYNEYPAFLDSMKYTGMNHCNTEFKPQINVYQSNLLRSNCKVTKQPDHGTIYNGINTPTTIVQEDLLKYIVSFRNENHFHEEISERIFTRIMDIIKPVELFVACFYTRRGGIDINPIRCSHKYLLNDYFQSYIKIGLPNVKTARQ